MNNDENESIFNGILKYSISTWVNFVVSLLSVVVTTRLIDPENYGMISIFISASSVVMYVFALGLDGAYIRFYNDPPNGDTKTQLLYKGLIISSILCLVFSFVGFFGFSHSLSQYIFGVDKRLLIGLLFVYSFCQVALRFLNISFRMGFQTRKYNVQSILINCLMRILIIASALITNDYSFVLTVVTSGILLTLIIYCVIQRKEYIPYNTEGKLSFSLSLKEYGGFFRFALFSAPTYIVAYLNVFLAQQVIRSQMGAYSVGIFSSTGMFSSIISAVQGGFATYWAAYVYKNHSKAQQRIIKMHDYILVFAIIISSCLVVFRDVIYVFIGKEYHESKVFFSLLLVLPILNLIRETTDKGIALKKRNEITLINHSISVITNVGLCYALIPSFGLKGAAIANAISGIVLYATESFFGQKYYRSIDNRLISIVGTICVLGVLSVSSLFTSYAFICVIIIDVIFAIIFHKQIHDMVAIIVSTLKHLLKKKN